MAEKTTIRVDWGRMRDHAGTIYNFAYPEYTKWKEKIRESASGLDEYSSELTSQLSKVLRNLADERVEYISSSLAHYIGALKTTADINEETNAYNAQGIRDNASNVSIN